jgi:DnaJ like chaperone protein
LVQTFGEEGALSALQLLKELLKKDINHIAVANQISKHINYSTRLEFIHLLLDLAKSDGDLVIQEENVIRQIADAMYIQTADTDSLFAMYIKPKDTNWAYKVLEIEPTATNEEVKKAYRRMAMKYHPDKVNNSGEEIYKTATEKFREVNNAYEHIKDIRGMK